jgi:hypothetical protein
MDRVPTPHPTSSIQHPKSKIQNPKSKIQNPKLKIASGHASLGCAGFLQAR